MSSKPFSYSNKRPGFYKRQTTLKTLPAAIKKTKTNTKAMEKYIENAIMRQIETKKANSQWADDNVGGVADTAIGTQIIPISPYAGFIQLTQGTGDGQRVGNKVRTAYARINYTVFPNPYNAVSNNLVKPIIYQMFLLRDKKNPTTIPDVVQLLSTLYNAGNTVTPATGTVRDLTFSINTDRWQVFKRWTHKLGYAMDNVQGTVAANQYFANNDFQMFIHNKVPCTNYMHKVYDFDDGTAYPSTPGVFLFYYVIYADGSTVPDGQYGAQFRLSIDYQYKDA